MKKFCDKCNRPFNAPKEVRICDDCKIKEYNRLKAAEKEEKEELEKIVSKMEENDQFN